MTGIHTDPYTRQESDILDPGRHVTPYRITWKTHVRLFVQNIIRVYPPFKSRDWLILWLFNGRIKIYLRNPVMITGMKGKGIYGN